MCIIAALPANVEIDKETFMTCWDNNDDGFGMMYVDNGKVVIEKSMIKKVAWRIYNRVRQHYPDSAKVLHWRIGTHGTRDLFNCHPFVIHQDELCFVHNGIITNVADDPLKLRSDTQMFNDLILKHLPPTFYKDPVYIELIEEYIGLSKLVFLDKNNEIYIVKKRLGKMEGDVWFSNETYKKSRYYGSSTGYSYGYSGNYKGGSNSAGNTNIITWEKCEYCGEWLDTCVDYVEFGNLCPQCVSFLEEVGFVLEEDVTQTKLSSSQENDWDAWDDGQNNYMGVCY